MSILVDTSVLFRCYLNLCYQSLYIFFLYWDQLLTVTFSFSRCIRWHYFALTKVSRGWVIVFMSLGCPCFTWLFQTRVIVGSVSCPLLLSEIYILEHLSLLIPLNIRCRTAEIFRSFCRPKFGCGMTFPTLCLTLERWTGLRQQSTVGCSHE